MEIEQGWWWLWDLGLLDGSSTSKGRKNGARDGKERIWCSVTYSPSNPYHARNSNQPTTPTPVARHLNLVQLVQGSKGSKASKASREDATPPRCGYPCTLFPLDYSLAAPLTLCSLGSTLIPSIHPFCLALLLNLSPSTQVPKYPSTQATQVPSESPEFAQCPVPSLPIISQSYLPVVSHITSSDLSHERHR